jgi:DNA (cytosine-5)-methyltransferase 1
MNRPRLLDLFCGAGGATRGYQQAGFYVCGVDIEPQPNYVGDEFISADALLVLASNWVAEFDAIHASPPCQRFAGTYQDHSRHPDLLTPVRELLKRTGMPYVIENIATAPMPDSILLCGATFDLPLIRHRRFEIHPDPVLAPSLCPQSSHGRGVQHKGRYAYGRKTWQPNWRKHVLPVVWPWMTVEESGQAIPPAYTEWIGARLLEHLAEVAA